MERLMIIEIAKSLFLIYFFFFLVRRNTEYERFNFFSTDLKTTNIFEIRTKTILYIFTFKLYLYIILFIIHLAS